MKYFELLILLLYCFADVSYGFFVDKLISKRLYIVYVVSTFIAVVSYLFGQMSSDWGIFDSSVLAVVSFVIFAISAVFTFAILIISLWRWLRNKFERGGERHE